MKSLCALIIILLLTSCELRDNPIFSIEEDLKNAEVIQMDSMKDLPEFTLTSFSDFPEEIEGCSCYFSMTKNAFGDQQYIYAGTSLDSIGYIKKQGDWVKLIQQPVQQLHDSVMIQAQNDSIMLRIRAVKDSSAYETIQYKGELKVTKFDQEVFSGEIYGECGC